MKIQYTALLAASLTLAGCHSPINTVENAQQEGQRAMISDQRVINNTALNRRVYVVGVNTVTTPAGLLQVQVEVFNRTRSPQRFNYSFEWFDANGMHVGNLTPAVVPGQVQGGESQFIQAVAPTLDSRDFRLKLMRGS